MLGQSRSGTLNCSQAELEDHLFQRHHDPYRGEELPLFEGLTSVHEPKCAFNLGQIQLKEVQEVVKKERANSSPGPSGLAYAVYKRCPKLLCRLWKLLKAIWFHQRMPEEWNRAEGIYVPKEGKSTVIGQFRQISLLSVEGKIFYSIVAKRITKFLLKNECIDNRHTKGGSACFL